MQLFGVGATWATARAFIGSVDASGTRGTTSNASSQTRRFNLRRKNEYTRGNSAERRLTTQRPRIGRGPRTRNVPLHETRRKHWRHSAVDRYGKPEGKAG